MRQLDLALALTELEVAEQPLLAWGVTDGAFLEDEAIELLARRFPDHDPEDMLEELVQARLVRELDGRRLRTRTAETVRLAVSLRQMFSQNTWRTAPTLVSDYRFISSPRSAPRRDAVSESTLLRRASERADASDDVQTAISDVLGGRTVSEFQARSAERLLQCAKSGRNTGTVVTAGTGAGKSLAFYLPALAHVMGSPSRSRSPRVVAIYPRVELLRDQLASLMETLDRLGKGRDRVPSVGVLYGASPSSRQHAAERGGWRRRGEDLECPILNCPRCGSLLRWPAKRDVLECTGCKHHLTGQQLKFLRQDLRSHPPEILFTTTEMVNIYLGHPNTRRLFVGDGAGGPEFILLDEIHTYSGTHGAQVANLLRRWRAECSYPTSFVGLSATLADPVGFFAELTGLSTGDIASVSPTPEEMVETGREYLLVLRGDPASQTSLLSTTIQTSMLMRRMLDPDPTSPSHGLFGSKVFAFTDDLDIVNRLHHQLSDAEGWLPGGMNQKPTGSLANLRLPGGDDRDRDEAGQLWTMASLLGTMSRPARVARTTSQDSGVDQEADIVVATASLEVGFDDPDVGAVVQHKAPRDAAQFLQRKGRAGRDPMMRPWTSVVLSDYGRDRLAFQSYEAIASPVVRPAKLPTRNRVLLKIQGAWAMLDLLGKDAGSTTVRQLLSGQRPDPALTARLLRTVDDLMTPAGLERLQSHIRRVLSLSDDEARSVVWDPPRALASAVLPTLHRSIIVASKGADANDGRTPLWEFAPSSLFAALLTPEVKLVSARPREPGRDDESFESVSRALRMFAPGRVSYRYALRGRGQRMWALPPAANESTLDLKDILVEADDLEVPDDAGVNRLLSPVTMRLTPPDPAVPDMAYGTLDWRLSVEERGLPLQLDLPSMSRWEAVLSDVSAFTHRYGAPLRTVRYATQVVVDRRTKSDPLPTVHNLSFGNDSAALGFEMEVDALRCTVRVEGVPALVASDAALRRALRPAWFEHLADTDDEFVALVPSKFQRAWLAQLFMSGLVALASSTNRPLDDALRNASDAELRRLIIETAQEIFGVLDTSGDDHPSDGDRLLKDITELVSLGTVVGWLRRRASVLWEQVDELRWDPWVRERLLVTIGTAIVQAIQLLCPESDIGELRLEAKILESPHEQFGEVLIVEDEPGGSGVVEAFVDRYVDDPRSFWHLVAAALQEGEQERVASAMQRMLLKIGDTSLRTAVDQVRSAVGLAATTDAWRALRSALYQRGLPTDTSVVSAIATRVVRPGSSHGSEALLRELLEGWIAEEERFGIELELRVFAYLASQRKDLNAKLSAIVGSNSTSPGWAYTQFVGLLWNRGNRLRSAALQSYNPYTTLLPTERLLCQALARPSTGRVDATDADWRAQLDEVLLQQGNVLLCCVDGATMADAIAELAVTPTYLDSLETYPRVSSLLRSATGLEALIEIREVVQ